MGERIAKLRKAKKWSQSNLAKLLNISPSAVGMYEQGRRTPSLETLVLLSRLLDTTLEYLVIGVFMLVLI